MPVFKAFFAIAKKRRNAALIYLGVYAVITLLLSALSQDSINENFKASQRSIAITDEDNTDASRALCDYLASIHQVTTPEPGEDTALLDAIYYRTLNYAMVIPEGFEDRVLAGETKDLVSSLTIPGSSSSQYVDNQITQYVQALQLYLAGGDTIAEAIDHTDHTISDLPKVSVTSFQMSDADTNSMVFYFFQYLPYIFLAILFAGMAPILVTLNSRDMKARTACSALPGRTRTLAMASGCLLYSLGIWLLFLLLGLVFYQKAMLQPYVGLCNLKQPRFPVFYGCTLPAHLDVPSTPDDNVLNLFGKYRRSVHVLSLRCLCPAVHALGSVLAVGRFLPLTGTSAPTICWRDSEKSLRPGLLLEMHRHPVPLCRRHVRPDCCRSETEKGAVALSEPPF